MYGQTVESKFPSNKLVQVEVLSVPSTETSVRKSAGVVLRSLIALMW